MSLFAKLKRRNVFRVAIAYFAVSWLLIQVAETVFPVYGLSDAPIRFVITAVAVGFIPILVISWVFELTPSGLKRDAEVDHTDATAIAGSKKFDRIIIVALAWPFGFARIYAWIGNKDEAFRFLKIKAEQEGYIPGLSTHPLFTQIHDDPRWLPFLHSIGEAPEQLAEIEFNPRLPYEVSARK